MPIGKPAINNPRTLDLREISAIVSSIRERLAAVEAALAGVSDTVNASSSASTSSGGTSALLRSMDNAASGLLAKIDSRTVRGRSLEVPAELDVENPAGLAGNPTLTWVAQAAALVFASPADASGTPSFRSLGLASADFAGQGSMGTVLHGNEYGAPSWGPVDLAFEVSGVLPIEHLAGTYDIDILGAAGKLTPATVPASSLSDGEEGQFTWDADFLYVCMGPYTWRRVALSEFYYGDPPASGDYYVAG